LLEGYANFELLFRSLKNKSGKILKKSTINSYLTMGTETLASKYITSLKSILGQLGFEKEEVENLVNRY
jgi:hypothetical protein